MPTTTTVFTLFTVLGRDGRRKTRAVDPATESGGGNRRAPCWKLGRYVDDVHVNDDGDVDDADQPYKLRFEDASSTEVGDTFCEGDSTTSGCEFFYMGDTIAPRCKSNKGQFMPSNYRCSGRPPDLGAKAVPDPNKLPSKYQCSGRPPDFRGKAVPDPNKLHGQNGRPPDRFCIPTTGCRWADLSDDGDTSS